MTVHTPITRSKAVTVFYDGGCPLCYREIRHYRSLEGADRVEWVDITQDKQRLYDYGISVDQAMARFHVLDEHGVWHTGAAGFVVMWKQLPYYRWLAYSFKRLRLVAVAEWFYRHFAKRRYHSRCKDGSCRLTQ